MLPINLSWDTILEAAINFLPRLGAAALILLVAHLLSKWLARFLRKRMEQRQQDAELIVLLEMITRLGILTLGIVLALDQIAPGRFNTLIAGLGIGGIAIGFGLQDIIKNFISGILILLQQPFEIGDSIEVSGFGGTVLNISVRATELKTWDGRIVIIPNGDVYASAVVNYSKSVHRRVSLTVGVGYDSDLDKVARVTHQVITALPGVLKEPPPSVTFQNFSESSIDFALQFWTDTMEVGIINAQDAAIKALKEAFDREGIDIPYPTLSIISTPV
ncbi:MAG: mechanosensitive ion channel [Chloroflexi bacterium]|nr:mechanosensitive ion channel [Chloroflexota bacterium]